MSENGPGSWEEIGESSRATRSALWWLLPWAVILVALIIFVIVGSVETVHPVVLHVPSGER